MSLYTRGVRPSFGVRDTVQVYSGEGMLSIVKGNPLSPLFSSPVSNPNARRINHLILNYLIAVQIRQYQQSISIPNEATLAHIKRALESHSPEYLCRSIRWAAMISKYPYSIGFALKAFEAIGGQFDIRFGEDQKPNKPASSPQSLFD